MTMIIKKYASISQKEKRPKTPPLGGFLTIKKRLKLRRFKVQY